jgi:hypothetical protein
MPASSRRWGALLGTVVLWGVMLVQAALPGRSAETRQPNLQGSWKVNADLTARLTKDQAQEGEGHAGGGTGDHGHQGLGGMGPIGGGDNGSPPGVGDWSLAKVRRDAEARREVVAFLDSLTIVQQAGQITITDQSGHARVLKPDGSKVRDQGPAGPAQLRASWDRDGSLLVEVKPDKGTRRTEAYVVSNDRKHLFLTVTIPGQQDQIVRAYDPAPAPTAPPPPPAPVQDPKSPRETPGVPVETALREALAHLESYAQPAGEAL